MEAKIKSVLSPAQYARYQELSLQLDGARALLRPEVGESLGLTQEQTTQIRNLQIESFRMPPPPGDDMVEPPRPPSFEEMEQRRAEFARKAMSVLTSEQRRKWEGMLGKPFRFEQPPMRRQGG
jgi:hypothetical protein